MVTGGERWKEGREEEILRERIEGRWAMRMRRTRIREEEGSRKRRREEEDDSVIGVRRKRARKRRKVANQKKKIVENLKNTGKHKLKKRRQCWKEGAEEKRKRKKIE